MRQFLTLVLLLICASKIFAQEVPTYNHYFLNPFVYNSAYAGSEGKPAVYLNYRNQWSGIEGAPVTSSFSIHAPLKNGVNLGFNIYTDKRSILSTSVAGLTFGYTVDFNYDHFMQFGISAGVGINVVDQDASLNLNDPAIVAILDNSSYLDGNFGFLYHVGDLNVGLSLPRIFDNNRFLEDPFAVEPVSPLDNYIISANYRFYFMNDDWALEPHVLYRKLSYAIDPVVEGSLIVHANHMIWGGASYRQGYGLIGLVGLKSTNWAVGYSYDFQGPQVAGGLNMTHEIQMGILIDKPQPRGRRRRVVNKGPQKPIVSFLASQNIEFQKKKTEVARNNNDSGDFHATLGKFDDQQSAEVFKLDLRKAGFDVRLARSAVDQKYYVYSDNVVNTRLSLASMKVAYVLKSELIDINRSEYIVVLDDFDNEDDAEIYKQDLRDRGVDAHNGQSIRNGLYYVYTMRTDQRALAVREARRITDEGIGNATFVDVDKDEIQNVEKAAHYVTLGSFDSEAEAEEFKEQMRARGISVHDGHSVHFDKYYVFTNRVASEEAARAEAEKLRVIDGIAGASYIDVDKGDIIEVTEAEYFITLGSYRSVEEAQASQNDLRSQGISVHPNYVERNGRYYIYTTKIDTDDEAKLELDRLINEKGIFTVSYQGLDRKLMDELASASGSNVVVTRGNHVVELPTGIYVVVSSFSSIDMAAQFSNTAVLPGYETKYGFSSERQLFYVYLHFSEIMAESVRAKDEIRQIAFFNRAWTLEVR